MKIGIPKIVTEQEPHFDGAEQLQLWKIIYGNEFSFV